MRPYRQLFDRVLTRTDPERAHHAAFRAIRAAQPVTRMLNGRRTQGREGPHDAGDGPGLPGPARSRGGLRQERRRHRRPGQHGVRVRRDRHRHRGAAARQPQAPARPAAGRPRGRQPDGLQQRRRRGRLPPAGRAAPRPHRPPRSACPSASTSARPRWSPRTTPSATTRRAPPCSRRTPTTWSSTSPRRTRRGCATCRPSQRLDPLLRGRTQPRRRHHRPRTCPLLVKIAPDLDDEDVLAVADLAVALGPGRDRRHQHHDLPRRARLVRRAGRGRRCRRALRATAARACHRGDATAARPGRRRS